MERVVYHDGNVLPSRGTKCTAKEGRTRQSDAKAADINAIMERFDFDALNAEFRGRLDRGEAPWIGADVSQVGDFRTALELLRSSEEYFGRLPADVRAEFGNQVANLVDAWNAGEKPEVFRRIGLLPPDEEAELDKREAAAEARAERRKAARAKEARVKAAEAEPVPPGEGGKGGGAQPGT